MYTSWQWSLIVLLLLWLSQFWSGFWLNYSIIVNKLLNVLLGKLQLFQHFQCMFSYLRLTETPYARRGNNKVLRASYWGNWIDSIHRLVYLVGLEYGLASEQALYVWEGGDSIHNIILTQYYYESGLLGSKSPDGCLWNTSRCVLWEWWLASSIVRTGSTHASHSREGGPHCK